MSIDFYAGVPTYGNAVEPMVEVDDVVFDASGFPWHRGERGWIAAGDTHEQDWNTVRRWF